ncbi:MULTISPECIES: hypothetical protein [Asticcacaulis]|uniref:hypothetical protein n=1 Tax=Asticcacaulis TaxID=76890 RepID=UPI001AEACDCC|nr:MULTISPECIES: hypothetical protein [Asticcacaulis]MBP2158525.1 hypothetical protein [Asticcacaulis solisilvae]MDR6799571.1 hypothetical protein [Asticcacaulis sp. BE141]
MELRLNFALEGFRLLKARPKLLLFWGLVCLFGYGICALLLVAIVGPHHGDILAFNKKQDDVALALLIAGRIFTALAACTPVYLITSTVLICAICRASLEAGDDRLGYLRFGLTELRVLAVQAATFGLSVGLFWAVAIAWSILGLPVQFTPIGIFIAFLAVAWLRLRLSLNAVQSFATRRVDIFGSFQLTRGRSIALLGGYLLAFGLSMIVSYLSEAAIDGVTLLAFGQQQANIPLNLTSLDAFLTPPRVVILVLWLGLAWPQTTAIIHGAPVAAYRDIAGIKP